MEKYCTALDLVVWCTGTLPKDTWTEPPVRDLARCLVPLRHGLGVAKAGLAFMSLLKAWEKKWEYVVCEVVFSDSDGEFVQPQTFFFLSLCGTTACHSCDRRGKQSRAPPPPEGTPGQIRPTWGVGAILAGTRRCRYQHHVFLQKTRGMKEAAREMRRREAASATKRRASRPA